MNAPDVELIEFPIVIDSKMMAIGNQLHELDSMVILKIGKEKTYDKCMDFEKKIKISAGIKEIHYINKIIEIDQGDTKTFGGGSKVIFGWYRSHIQIYFKYLNKYYLYKM